MIKKEPTYKMEYIGGDDNNIDAGVITPLEGNGDFRNKECLDILDEADIVVTNPPFSLFREYIAVLMEHEKRFLIIGNKNAVTYKNFFPSLKNGDVWIGYNNPSEFDTPDGRTKKIDGLTCWFTNLGVAKRHELILRKKYASEEYPRYDNYDAIEVSKVSDIPVDYEGVMGVPITFLEKYNPDQFEILGLWNAGRAGDVIGAAQCEAVSAGKTIVWNGPTVNGKTKYFRILIRARHQG